VTVFHVMRSQRGADDVLIEERVTLPLIPGSLVGVSVAFSESIPNPWNKMSYWTFGFNGGRISVVVLYFLSGM